MNGHIAFPILDWPTVEKFKIYKFSTGNIVQIKCYLEHCAPMMHLPMLKTLFSLRADEVSST